ncbi:HpcH/HpaI aldolase/citrate lyase family protein [Sulfurimonas sp.]|uniref:HpcH/HpaI aldolase/citrate lyase family protein n=1 Tax=Sulfurimonas sp. TaxID=2022749 RepID=UPI003D0ECA16
MKRAIHYTQFGGTLFVPASHKNIQSIIKKEKYQHLRSLVIDFEDGLDADELQNSFRKIEKAIKLCDETSPFIFIRPKDVNHLKEILTIEFIDKIDGFILPKFSLTNMQSYLDVLKDKNFYIMPSIEGSELFDYEKLKEIQKFLLTHKEKILLVRFGLEDMLRQLSLKRGCEDSVFDLAVGNVVLGNFIAVFKSAGFAISGGVYPCFKDVEGFRADVLRDLKEGLFSKTIIHPDQIELVDELYKVNAQEYHEAQELLESKNAVFNQNDKMAETHTMAEYAEFILTRAKVYGLKS